ncbi:hypothetical protein LCGC14_2191270 [marine sediment metagenome]|uniref:Transglycosylase SLT domain-containing protein n=1 Tax=marine sediment metagenome TaxID=412755 RepID=A0A0F9GFC4_9ZZZZ
MSDMAAFRLEVVRPTLIHLQEYHPQMWSPAAENLIMGTAAHESAGLKYVRQISGGPALGAFQMEPATVLDIWDNYLKAHLKLRNLIVELLWPWPEATDLTNQLVWNPTYATAMARLVYWRRPEPLPDADDIEGLAQYWGRFYQTSNDPEKIQRFVFDYNFYVKE